MGDRSNIVIQDGGRENRVYLYSHWRGQSVLKSAVHGLRSGRVDDPAYLARIVFQHMLDGDKGETGYGISTTIQDNEHPILVIEAGAMNPSVWFEGEQTEIPLTRRVPYQEFLAALDSIEGWQERAEYGDIYGMLTEAFAAGAA